MTISTGHAMPAGKGFKIPGPLLFVLVPLAGLAFVAFFPLFGLALFAYAMARKLSGHLGAHATSLAATLSADQAVGAAHLAGHPGAGGATQDAADEAAARALQAEIERRRGEYPRE